MKLRNLKDNMNLDKSELAWAAGFFDGEGCSFLHGKIYPAMEVQQIAVNDEHVPAVIERFYNATGKIGKLYNRKYDTRRWSCAFHGWERAQTVLAMLWPYLSLVKRAQAKEVFTKARGLTRFRKNGQPFKKRYVKIQLGDLHGKV